jgi:uncharacterized protein (TIGR03437 family)
MAGAGVKAGANRVSMASGRSFAYTPPGVLAGFAGGALPLELGGTEVLFNGIRAPLRWAGNGQVDALVPFELSGSRTASLHVRVNGYLSNVAHLPVLTAEPAIFSYQSGFALALNRDGSINSQQNPAQLGSVVTIFVNGAGLQTPTPADGTLAPFGPLAASPVEVQAPVPGSYGEPIWETPMCSTREQPRARLPACCK